MMTIQQTAYPSRQRAKCAYFFIALTPLLEKENDYYVLGGLGEEGGRE